MSSGAHLWKWACLIAAVGCVVFFATAGRAVLDQCLTQLRLLGPLPFFAVFALCISFGVPPTPFLLAAGAAFGVLTNLVGFTISYAISLIIAYGCARPLFKRQLDAFMERKAPFVSGLLRENSVLATLLVRLTPGFPYVLQNCLLVSVSRSFRAFLLVSLPPLISLSMLYASLGRNLMAKRYGLLAFFLALLAAMILLLRFILRRRAGALKA